MRREHDQLSGPLDFQIALQLYADACRAFVVTDKFIVSQVQYEHKKN